MIPRLIQQGKQSPMIQARNMATGRTLLGETG